ncbi:MAG: DUF2924 domain-containing protein [Pseudomonadota bacterium]|jgi:hypothetical protein|nr:DUF2924 domain-containing protein [Calditrichota bacterium]MEC8066389.1 DUF2924 domain-containing protein [Pseudomonadota bacterium]MEC8476333.1 DUF2924 domain-containing protein [Pseudomonadota bacterium]
MTTTLHQDDQSNEIQVSVPAELGPIMTILGMNDNAQLPKEEADLFMIRQFARLQLSTITALKDEYKRCFYEMCPETMSKEEIILKLMKRLYVELNAPEKVWKEIKDERLTEYAYRVLQTAKRGDRIKLPRGLWLIRKYKRKKHTIRCLENCYLYQDNYYKSLTEIARLITGTDVSGPSFFKRSTEVIMDHR